MQDRDFKGIWIPKEIWLDDRLSALDKMILMEIDSLDKEDDHCWASNEYLGEFCQCSGSKVSRAITKLIKLGFIRVFSFDGRVRRLQSCLTENASQTCKKSKADLQKEQGIILKENTKRDNISRKRSTSEIPAGFTQFYNLYPKKVAKQSAVKAWCKAGIEDSQALIDTILADVQRRMDGEWKGKEMQYIPHPSTYINQRRWEDETTGTDKVEYEEPVLTLQEQLRRGGYFADDE